MKFIRRNWNRFSKLGKKRKKKQVWRRAKGRDNKIREKRKGYPAKVAIGYQQKKGERGLIKNKKPVIVKNLKDLERINKNEIAVIGKIGKKKKIEIIKKAKEKGILIHNINIKRFLKSLEKKKEAKKEENKEKTPQKSKIFGARKSRAAPTHRTDRDFVDKEKKK